MGEFVLVFLVAIAALPGWLGVEGLWKGVVRVRGVSYSRSEEPYLYWLSVVTYLGLAAAILYSFFHMLLGDQPHPVSIGSAQVSTQTCRLTWTQSCH